MTAWRNATKATTNFNIFKDEVAKAAGIPVSRMNIGRLHKAYDMGEPVWMVAEEMSFLAEFLMPEVKPFKNPSVNSIVCVKRVKL